MIDGSTNSISAPSPQILSGITYTFVSWSDRGARSHNVVASGSPSASTAIYAVDNQPPSSCTITGTPKGEILTGTSGPDHIYAGSGSDTVKGLGDNDSLKGGHGDDKLHGGEGNAALNGGAHVNGDTANFSESLGAVTASLTDNMAAGEGNDTLAGVEKIVGSTKNDTLTRGVGADTLSGRDDADRLTGHRGW